MFDLAIIGAGPRGLSVAIQAYMQGLKVVLIDSNPIGSWSPLNLISDMYMRSPSSFDLFTFVEGMEEFSLRRFMGLDSVYTTQKDVELDKTEVHRDTFYKYLNNLFSTTINNLEFVRDRVVHVESNKIVCTNRKLLAKNIVLAMGSCSIKPISSWLSSYKSKIISLSSLLNIVLNSDIKSKRFTIVGSGQGSAEVVYYLSQFVEHTVYWIVKDLDVNVKHYPVPSYYDWLYKSALSGFYRNLNNSARKLNYLSEVKKFQPTITPRVFNNIKPLLDTKINRLLFNKSSNLEQALNQSDYIIVMNGLYPTVNLLPLGLRSIKTNQYLPNYPDLSEGFKTSIDNVFITGALAIPFDGPRQGSLISSGITAREIINNLRI